MPYFNIVAQTSENTVVTSYTPVSARSDAYQSEAAWSRSLFACSASRGIRIFPFIPRMI